eukprot:15330883-Ditylum_brightwellii.AAC.1
MSSEVIPHHASHMPGICPISPKDSPKTVIIPQENRKQSPSLASRTDPPYSYVRKQHASTKQSETRKHHNTISMLLLLHTSCEFCLDVTRLFVRWARVPNTSS